MHGAVSQEDYPKCVTGHQATASTIAGTPWNISSIGPARCGHLFDSPEATMIIRDDLDRVLVTATITPPRRPATSPYVSSPDTLRRQAAKCSEDMKQGCALNKHTHMPWSCTISSSEGPGTRET
eukprot:6137617-Amphidinium_carterae.1